MVTLRKLSQLIFLVVAVYLAIIHNSLIFKIDPLHFLVTSISSRQVVVPLLWSLIPLILTLFLGRYFCGWVCPVGTMLDIIKVPSIHSSYRFVFSTRFKYYLLISIGITAILGLQLSWLLDPFSLLHRAIGVIPYNKPVIIVSPSEKLLFVADLSRIVVVTLFLSILVANLFDSRFWCKTHCPLGALYGILARFSWLNRKINDKCINCKKCETVCPMDTIDPEKFIAKKSECTICFECQRICPANAIEFGFNKKTDQPKFSLSRRYLLTSFVAGVVTLPLLRLIKTRCDYTLIRPPGVVNDQEFLDKCIRCSKCMEICPTQGLLPAVLSSKLEGFYSPHLVPRIGYCAYSCNQCGQVCPTGAIPSLSLTAKQKFPIGIAAINYTKCIRCLTCEEMCPVPEKAIHIREEQYNNKLTSTPYVVPDLCIGCGICENKCPVQGTAAIRVYNNSLS